MSQFRVKAWPTNNGAGRGRKSTISAIIDDAGDAGFSSFANSVGECFFTLPWNHPQISALSPLQTHIELSRLSTSGAYVPMWVGLLDDYSASRDEVIFHAHDYLNLLDTTITGANTSYTNSVISAVISTELQSAIVLAGDSANSRLGFMATGAIQTTSKTATLLTSYQSRLQFIQGIMGILSAGGTTSPILSITRSAPITISFTSNAGSDRENVRLEYGGNLRAFLYEPGYGDLITDEYAIGQKRQGASILFSRQTYADKATYGYIQAGTVFIDIVDQQALDDRTLDLAREQGVVGHTVGITVMVSGVVPWDGWDLYDAIRVKINRGIVNVNNLYRVHGVEWTATKSGSESLFLDLRLKRT